MKRRYLIIIAILVLLLCGFWPQISKTATGVAQKTIQIVSSTGTVLGTGGANAGPAPAETVNVVDSTNHIVDSFGANLASPGPIGGTTSSTGQFTQLAVGASVPTLPTNVGEIQGLVLDLVNNGCASQSGANGICQDNSGNIKLVSGGATVLLCNNGTGLCTFPFGLTATNGKIISSTGGVVPTCSASTGTCVTVTGSTNNRGQIHLTGGTAVTSITLTFSAAGSWPQAPFCTVGSGTAVVAGLTSPTGACASTASCAFAVSSTTAADINYTCM